VRAARALDFHRRLRERAGDWPFKLERFSFSGVPSLGEGDVPFLSPLTVISGPNGVGKTTLLRAIWASANPTNAVSTAITAQKLQGGKASLSFQFHGEAKKSEVTFARGTVQGGTDLGVEVLHLDSASEVAEQQKLFCAFSTIEDLINGVGSKSLEGKILAKINYLARRDYRSVQLYEVEDGNGGAIPFFEVAFGDDRYDSRTMGAGELAIFFLWWSIERASENAMVLVEEPEVYLSPASQAALCNFLVESAVEKHLIFVVTSHSAEIISSLSDENLVFIFRRQQGIKVVDGPPPPALLETIGIAPSVDIIVFVEDDAAATFCGQLLERFKPSLARRVEISPRSGDGNIIAALRSVGDQFRAIKFVGLFDGDARARIPADVEASSVLLPGDKPIEIIFRELVEADPAALTNAIGSQNLEVILFGLQGRDHHDWYEGLCQQLGLTKAQLFPTLLQIWMRHEENATLASATVDALAKFAP